MTYHLHNIASVTPHKLALVFEPSGRSRTFVELETEANMAANALRSLGLVTGDCIALCLENSPELLALTLGAQRIGLYYVLASTKLSTADLNYILADSAARFAIISGATEAAQHASGNADFVCAVRSIGWPEFTGSSWNEVFTKASKELPSGPLPGREMVYTSGTTGRPKGVRKPAFTGAFDAVDSRNAYTAAGIELTSDSVYLSTSPLYHAAPNRYLSAAVHFGATSIVMERFDARPALDFIARYKCTHSLWVPTMFHRLLRLPQQDRQQSDVSSMRMAVHGAAPCPVHLKEQMIDWWGPVLYEYYSGTEGIGATSISSQEWLLHKGSVGRAKDGILHILDNAGREVPTGTVGLVFFESDAKFEYWNDPVKTQGIHSAQGWRSFGDVGYMDADEYLYLTDRKDFTINSGGVKIYPQEIEDALLGHAGVQDVAVFGVPNPEFGEEVIAVVQPASPSHAGAELEAVLRTFCRETLGPIKTPRRVYFETDFPRHDTGKLYKKALKDKYSLPIILA